MSRTKRRLYGCAIVAAILGGSLSYYFALSRTSKRDDLRPARALETAKLNWSVPILKTAWLVAEDGKDDVSAKIEGIVETSAGTPVAGATVSLAEWSGSERAGWPLGMLNVQTDAGGRFTIPALKLGGYLVSANAAHNGLARQAVKLTHEKPAVSLRMTLSSRGYRLHGTVFDLAGGSVFGALVSAEGRGGFVYQTRSSSDGGYELYLHQEFYNIVVTHEAYSKSIGRVEEDLPKVLNFHLQAGASISGIVTSKSSVEESRRAMVTAYQVEGPSEPRDFEATQDGNFVFNGLPPGSYIIRARQEHLSGESELIVVGDGAVVTDVRIHLSPSATISGLISDDEGAPVWNGAVIVEEVKDKSRQAARSGQDGRYQTDAVRSGTLRLTAYARDFEMSRRTVEVPPGKALTDINFRLQRATTVTGTALLPDKSPVPGANITATVASDASSARKTARTDSMGRFVLPGLSSGVLDLSATHPKFGPTFVPPQKIASGQRLDIVITFGLSNCTIRGAVRLTTGELVPGARVRWKGPAAWNTAATTTDDKGEFLLGPVAPGSGVVAAIAPNGRDWEVFSRASLPITLEPGEQRAGLEVILPTRDGKITGVVKSQDGSPIQFASVGLRKETKTEPALTGGLKAAVATDAGGRFVLDGLPSGHYIVWARSESGQIGVARDVPVNSDNVVVSVANPSP